MQAKHCQTFTMHGSTKLVSASTWHNETPPSLRRTKLNKTLPKLFLALLSLATTMRNHTCAAQKATLLHRCYLSRYSPDLLIDQQNASARTSTIPAPTMQSSTIVVVISPPQRTKHQDCRPRKRGNRDDEQNSVDNHGLASWRSFHFPTITSISLSHLKSQ